jgi:FixJ family two-component response regulator
MRRPQKQIAAELGISVSAVEKHLQKAYLTVVEARSQLDADADLPPPRLFLGRMKTNMPRSYEASSTARFGAQAVDLVSPDALRRGTATWE